MLKIYVGHVVWVGEELLAKVQIMRDIQANNFAYIQSARQQRWMLNFVSSPLKMRRRKRNRRWQKPIYPDTKQVVF